MAMPENPGITLLYQCTIIADVTDRDGCAVLYFVYGVDFNQLSIVFTLPYSSTMLVMDIVLAWTVSTLLDFTVQHSSHYRPTNCSVGERDIYIYIFLGGGIDNVTLYIFLSSVI